MQNIPSPVHSVRPLFCGVDKEESVDATDNTVVMFYHSKIQTVDGNWVQVLELHCGDSVYVTNENDEKIMVTVQRVSQLDETHIVLVMKEGDACD